MAILKLSHWRTCSSLCYISSTSFLHPKQMTPISLSHSARFRFRKFWAKSWIWFAKTHTNHSVTCAVPPAQLLKGMWHGWWLCHTTCRALGKALFMDQDLAVPFLNSNAADHALVSNIKAAHSSAGDTLWCMPKCSNCVQCTTTSCMLYCR